MVGQKCNVDQRWGVARRNHEVVVQAWGGMKVQGLVQDHQQGYHKCSVQLIDNVDWSRRCQFER